MIDCKTYSKKDVVDIVKHNPIFNQHIAEGRDWNSTITYVKKKLRINKEQESEIKKYYNLKTK